MGPDAASKTIFALLVCILVATDYSHCAQRELTESENSVNGVEKVYVNDVGQVNTTGLDSGCECSRYSCGCCQHLQEPSIHLNSTVCANASYLSEDIGISVTVTVNQYTIFNETVSVRNPPPVCLGVPYVKEWAEACVCFYNIDATRSHLHACTEVEARLKHVVISKYDLGCFDIGPITSKTSHGEEEPVFEPPHVLLV